MQDRLISALIYAIAGIVLGIGIAITWAFHMNSTTSSALIIFNKALLCAVLGFVFPNQIQRLFTWLWKFFSN
ncbi:hypothetical protein [Acinetobacter sp. 102]|uniref:hypothetical protein n=1 Tax=Acinetobacter sp. 102 TaxID=3098766 RepID=UPI0030093BFD